MQINKEKFKKNKKILIPIISVISLFAILCVSLVVGSKDSLRNSEYQEKISSLNTQNINLHQNIVELNSQVSDLSKQLEILIASNNTYQQTITNQAKSIEELNLRLDAYKNELVKEVCFRVNGKLISVGLVEKDSSIAASKVPDVDESTLPNGYGFVGWSLDGTTIVDPSSVVVNEDTTFIAVLENPADDNPDTEIPDHNDIDEDRKEQEDDDNFWPE